MSVSADATKAASAASAFPNPKQVGAKRNLSEPLIMENGKLLPQVLLVNTFLGGDVEGRKSRYQQLGIPVLNVVHYQEGDKQAYLKDLAGVSSFRLPFILTTAEYIGIQDPVVLTSKESGEMITMPEQLDVLVGKAVKLARLALKSNADKKLALLFWNHPPVLSKATKYFVCGSRTRLLNKKTFCSLLEVIIELLKKFRLVQINVSQSLA
jgi:cobaltochelatase CobN